jgi:hypothetical protein
MSATIFLVMFIPWADSALTTKVGGTIFSFISAKESLPDVD